MAIVRRFARLLRGASAIVEHPDLIPLLLRGVPPRLALSIHHPWLRELGIRTVLDVGANTGQFALAARRAFPTAVIHSFEPLVDCFEELRRNTAGHPDMHAWNLALGEETGLVWLERNEFSPSSSILPLGEQHRRSFPFARRTEKVQVKIEALDGMASRLEPADPVLVKIDVQGFEDRVLRGGVKTVSRAVALIVETSFEQLYEGQMSHTETCHWLEGLGFEYHGALDQLSDPVTGRILSADSLFLKARGP
jgi:FkbM family methyltransferase